MKTNKVFHGFTLFEAIVVIILTTLFISFSLTAINMMGVQYNRYSNAESGVLSFMLFKEVLSNDMTSASMVLIHNNTLQFSRENQETLTYRFTDSIAMRSTNEHTDTFFNVNLICTKYRGCIIQQGLVDCIYVEVLIKSNKYAFILNKVYSAFDCFLYENNETCNYLINPI